MRVFRRSPYAWFALLGIVFSQLAISAYACPLWSKGEVQASAVAVHGQEMAGMPCAGMEDMGAESTTPVLCIKHCDQESQAAGSAHAPDFQIALALLPFAQPFAPIETTWAAQRPEPLLHPLAAPPPLWRTGRLRI
jgi:hypothetical protein